MYISVQSRKKYIFLAEVSFVSLLKVLLVFKFFSFFLDWTDGEDGGGGEYCHIVKKFRTSILFCDIYSVAINTQIYNDKFDIYFLASLSSYFFFYKLIVSVFS